MERFHRDAVTLLHPEVTIRDKNNPAYLLVRGDFHVLLYVVTLGYKCECPGNVVNRARDVRVRSIRGRARR